MVNIEKLLNRFPNLELSYETNVHKKVQSYDFCLAIPKGQKYFAWFTYYENQNICVLLEISKNKIITDIATYIVSFHSDLALNTILYGTFFKTNDINCFTIEDIYYYCGDNVSEYDQTLKLNIIDEMFSNKLKQCYYNELSVLFALPLMSNNDYELTKQLHKVNYPIYTIQYRKNYYGSKYLNYKQLNPTYTVFNVRPDIQNDIYYLYCLENHREVKYGIADIPNYKTSVMMNKLYRNIKENNNLDSLEESDSEDEFENVDPDKFVYLDKSYKMRCVFNSRFKKWSPVEIADDTENIVEKYKIYS